MSGPRKPPHARDRLLGAQLRAVRNEQTDLSLEAAAELTGWSASTMSRIENGTRHISTEEVATILTAYRVPANERDEMIERARAGRASGWWDKPLPGVPQEMGAFVSYEVEANHLTDWSPLMVPGLLQTYQYTVGYMTLDGLPRPEAEVRWMVRQRRQEVLNTGVDYTAYIGEAALRTPFGGPEALKIQLQHLCMAYGRGLTIRVVREHEPLAALLHPWVLMEFPELPPVVSVELARSAVYLHDREVEVYLALRQKLDQVALSAPESRATIGETIEGE